MTKQFLALMSIIHVHWANKEESLITLTKRCWLILRAPPLHINKESSINTYCRKVCHLKIRNAISNKFVPHCNHGIQEAPILLLHATTLVNKDEWYSLILYLKCCDVGWDCANILVGLFELSSWLLLEFCTIQMFEIDTYRERRKT